MVHLDMYVTQSFYVTADFFLTYKPHQPQRNVPLRIWHCLYTTKYFKVSAISVGNIYLCFQQYSWIYLSRLSARLSHITLIYSSFSLPVYCSVYIKRSSRVYLFFYTVISWTVSYWMLFLFVHQYLCIYWSGSSLYLRGCICVMSVFLGSATLHRCISVSHAGPVLNSLVASYPRYAEGTASCGSQITVEDESVLGIVCVGRPLESLIVPMSWMVSWWSSL